MHWIFKARFYLSFVNIINIVNIISKNILFANNLYNIIRFNLVKYSFLIKFQRKKYKSILYHWKKYQVI